MKKKHNKNPELISDHIKRQYGVGETPERERIEGNYDAFKLGVMLQELRKGSGLTQRELAERCGTTKTYISRIENNASDIRLSSLMRIFRDGFNKHMKLSIEANKKNNLKW